MTKISSARRDSWMLPARKPAGWKPRLELSRWELAALLRRTEYYDHGVGEAPERPAG